jgi:hypothetical protein
MKEANSPLFGSEFQNLIRACDFQFYFELDKSKLISKQVQNDEQLALLI